MDHEGEKESSFDAELYRLNKPKTGRLWLLPALQYFFVPGHPSPGPGHGTGRGLTLVCQLLSSGC